MGTLATDRLALADYRRRIAQLYLETAGEGAAAVAEFRRGRDEIFLHHPSSALSAAQRRRFEGLEYFRYDPAARATCELGPPESDGTLEVETGGEDGTISYQRIGRLGTPWGGLTLFWTSGYGGGIFVPFRDATAGEETYGGGRYLTDAIKGTFGGGVAIDPDRPGSVTLDFNYAYNPSCAYNSSWACPLAPPENRLGHPIRAGERVFADHV